MNRPGIAIGFYIGKQGLADAIVSETRPTAATANKAIIVFLNMCLTPRKNARLGNVMTTSYFDRSGPNFTCPRNMGLPVAGSVHADP